MLKIKNISKKYVTGDLIQNALKNVSIDFRDNEFVAILGPSGSGKTTLLNIIGGLDRYDDGDLIINGVSTKKYKDRDWDTYRNHSIGFVFQSYNLIPHQNVLSNVELALTIGGISPSERKRRAKEALEKVGLGEQLHKKPNQMSGGQMQRVAIARALVNNPDIVLADEPTGALDSDTSVQIMELLKEVAKEKLVIMVTHNPELAEQYANRIIKVKDGVIIDDSNPVEVGEAEPPASQNKKKASMSIGTALSLSFNNLKTKKARTILTSFAGSIGIIGIALILALSNGVNTYIENTQRKAMTSYPISIDSQTIDMSSFMTANMVTATGTDHSLDGVYSNTAGLKMASDMAGSITHNNLTAFKEYLDNPESEIHKYVGENGIVYQYGTEFDVYSIDSEGTLVNTDGSTFNDSEDNPYEAMKSFDISAMMSMGESNYFEEIMPGQNGEPVSDSIKKNYELVYGRYPEEYNELVLVVNRNNEIQATSLYELGILPASEYREIKNKIENGEDINLESVKWEYEDICNKEFYLIPASDYYYKNDDGKIQSISKNSNEIKTMIDDNKLITLKITGIIRQPEDLDTAFISKPIGYTNKLTEYIIQYTMNNELVEEQLKNDDIDIFTGASFEPKDDAQKIEDIKKYILEMSFEEQQEMMNGAAMFGQMSSMTSSQSFNDSITFSENQIPAGVEIPEGMTIPENMQTPVDVITEQNMGANIQAMLDAMDDEMLLMLYDMKIPTSSYEKNLEKLGYVDMSTPKSIKIYADTFESKDYISNCIEDFNKQAEDADKIEYTDYMAVMLSSVTTIVNIISYVLIAFVAVSLVVSSIMIGIITYISVLERTKEIGILRAIGASKKNISQVFNAETFIIGLCSGLIGIGLTLLLMIPGNAIIHMVTGSQDVNAILPVFDGIILIILSIILTLIGGWLPAKKAAKKDPVAALRTE